MPSTCLGSVLNGRAARPEIAFSPDQRPGDRALVSDDKRRPGPRLRIEYVAGQLHSEAASALQ